ncbi:hypothetical protein [Endozoicomonas elysicola]|uniref:Uncharacterized protein n=1 Tax=Endozoicomonas elysicola TaxID=305900 RepID=A0A081K7L4_9GAMM|nr:hypothetical protein [Endozoicomonas elysicola]KEI70140.1 hypothetical protein GV64_04695 [Endozoicomonas elysicola]
MFNTSSYLSGSSGQNGLYDNNNSGNGFNLPSGNNGVGPAPGMPTVSAANPGPYYHGNVYDTGIEHRGVIQTPSMPYLSYDWMPTQSDRPYPHPSAPPHFMNLSYDQLRNELSLMGTEVSGLSNGSYHGHEGGDNDWLNHLSNKLSWLTQQVQNAQRDNLDQYGVLTSSLEQLRRNFDSARINVLERALQNGFNQFDIDMMNVFKEEQVAPAQVSTLEQGFQSLSHWVNNLGLYTDNRNYQDRLTGLRTRLDTLENKSPPYRPGALDSGVSSVHDRMTGFQGKMSPESALRSVNDLGQLLTNFSIHSQNVSDRPSTKAAPPKLTALASKLAADRGVLDGAKFHNDRYVKSKVTVDVSKSDLGKIQPVIERTEFSVRNMSQAMLDRMRELGMSLKTRTVPGYIIYLVADDEKAFGGDRSFKLQLKTVLTENYAKNFSRGEKGSMYVPLSVALKIPEGLHKNASYFPCSWAAHESKQLLNSSEHAPFAFGKDRGGYKEDIGIYDVSKTLRSMGVSARDAASAPSGQVIPVNIELVRQSDHSLEQLKPAEPARRSWLSRLIWGESDNSRKSNGIRLECEFFEPERGIPESCMYSSDEECEVQPEGCVEGGVLPLGLDTTTAHGSTNKISGSERLTNSPALVLVRTISPGKEGFKNTAELAHLIDDRTADIERSLSSLDVM